MQVEPLGISQVYSEEGVYVKLINVFKSAEFC